MTVPKTIRCWRCSSDIPVAVFCSSCEAIQPLPAQIDYFSVLGVERSPAVDEAAVSTQYYDLSRRLHPDLYQTGTTQEQEASLQNTAVLNRAYRTLRDPVQRGVYWLELHGEKLGTNNNRVPPQLASLVFSVQEQLEELRDARQAGKEDEVASALAQIKTELEEQQAVMQDDLTKNFAHWRTQQDTDRQGGEAPLLAELKKILSEMAYLRTLLRDVEKESDVSWNA